MKSKNYLGKPDENRGILIFAALFIVILLGAFFIGKMANKNNKDSIVIEGDLSVVEKIEADVNKIELKDNLLTIEGVLNAGLTQSRIVKLRDVDLVLRNNNEDKYEYNIKYYISAEKIEFSSVLKNKVELNLKDVEPGEYTLLLRIKFESASNENGYAYKYYTLKASGETNNTSADGITISKENYKSVFNYLKVVKEQIDTQTENQEQ